MSVTNSFSSKDPEEIIVLSFDFTSLLAVGETISTCTFSVLDENRLVDASSAMKQGAADLTAKPIVKQQIIAGMDGHSYLVKAKVTTSAGNVYVGSSVLPVKVGA